MNSTLRILIALLLLAGILFLARGELAGAENLPAGQQAGLAAAGSDPNAAPADPGTVRPPPGEAELKAPGRVSVGGVCMVEVVRLVENVHLTVDWHPYTDLGAYPHEDIGRYLAGVCHVTYFKEGVQIADLVPADGEVHICFAGVPTIEGYMHVYDEAVYPGLETWSEDSLRCSTVPKTGKYFLATGK